MLTGNIKSGTILTTPSASAAFDAVLHSAPSTSAASATVDKGINS